MAREGIRRLTKRESDARIVELVRQGYEVSERELPSGEAVVLRREPDRGPLAWMDPPTRNLTYLLIGGATGALVMWLAQRSLAAQRAEAAQRGFSLVGLGTAPSAGPYPYAAPFVAR